MKKKERLQWEGSHSLTAPFPGWHYHYYYYYYYAAFNPPRVGLKGDESQA